MKRSKVSLPLVATTCLWLFPVLLSAGTDKTALAVTKDTLPLTPRLNDILAYISRNHPLALRADLLPVRAAAEQMKARGAFDPSLVAQSDQKYYEGKKYFSVTGGELKIPTWIGADIKTGYELNSGLFLDPERSTPAGGLFFGGISMPLVRGLLMDDRRFSVRSAGLKIQMADTKQQLEINDLLHEASTSYWDWFRAWHTLDTWRAAYSNARIRYEATLKRSASGERPLLDTLEARAQMQNLMAGNLQAEADWQKFEVQLSAYFWNPDNNTYGFTNRIQPPAVTDAWQPQSLDWAQADQDRFSHPYLEQLKIEAREIDLRQKWAWEQRKPSVTLQYTPLAEPIGNNIWNQLSLTNYKWGLDVRFPLLFRKERADIQLAKISEQENAFEFADKRSRLHSKVTALLAVSENYKVQYALYSSLVEQYRQLYEAETRLFTMGESTLFMVNLREQTYIQSKLKWIDIAVKYNQTLCDIYYFGGRMTDLAR